MKAASQSAPAAKSGEQDAHMAYIDAIKQAGGVGVDRICKKCGFKNESGTQLTHCAQCSEPLPMGGLMRADEKAMYEGLLVELAIQGQDYAKHVWPKWSAQCGEWSSYEPNPCLLNGCPCASKFLNGLKELASAGGGDRMTGPKTTMVKCDCKGAATTCDKCLGTGIEPQASWGRMKGRWCWHGTRTNDVYCYICHESLKPTLRAGQAYGPGEYFGVNPSVSLSYASGTNRQLVCFCFTGEVVGGGTCKGYEPDKAPSGRAGSLSSVWSHHNNFCYVLNNPGCGGCSSRASLPGRDNDGNVMYCIPVGIVSYASNESLNWKVLSCGAAILGARSTWDLPEFTDRLERARRIQVDLQREEQLMWTFMHHERLFRENVITHSFKTFWGKWPVVQESEGKQRFFAMRDLEKDFKEIALGPEAEKLKTAQATRKLADDQKARTVAESKLKKQLPNVHKKVAKDMPPFIRQLKMDEHNFLHWTVEFVGPQYSPFQDSHALKGRVEFSLGYPATPPKVRFDAQLFHPNVDSACLMHVGIDDEAKFAEACGGKPKPDQGVMVYMETVVKALLKPDFMTTQDGSLATGFAPDSGGYADWRKAAAAKHGTEDTMEDLPDAGEAAAEEGEGQWNRPRSNSGTRADSARGLTRQGSSPTMKSAKKRERSANLSYTEFCEILDEEDVEARQMLEKKKAEICGVEGVGKAEDRVALVQCVDSAIAKHSVGLQEHTQQFKREFLSVLKECTIPVKI